MERPFHILPMDGERAVQAGARWRYRQLHILACSNKADDVFHACFLVVKIFMPVRSAT